MNIDYLQDTDLINKTIDLSKGGIHFEPEIQPHITNKTTSSSPKDNSLISSLKSQIQTYSDKFKTFITPYIAKINLQPNYKIFLILLGIGSIFMVLSIMTLPFFVLFPTRFVMSFSLGNIFILTSFTFYFGGKEYVTMLISDQRKWITIGFIISLFVGLLFAWRKYFFMSLLFALLQLVAVCMFCLTFIPGGWNGINCMVQVIKGWAVKIGMVLKSKVLKKQNTELPA